MMLAQYYQRGILDWHSSPATCGAANNGFCIERRLAWDYFGGGLDGAPDQGFEPATLSNAPGPIVGAFGHRVSDVSTDGTNVGFAQFYERFGGVGAFGIPKTEARRDTNASNTVHIPAATAGFIRQYFQAGVMEYHQGDPDPPTATTCEIATIPAKPGKRSARSAPRLRFRPTPHSKSSGCSRGRVRPRRASWI